MNYTLTHADNTGEDTASVQTIKRLRAIIEKQSDEQYQRDQEKERTLYDQMYEIGNLERERDRLKKELEREKSLNHSKNGHSGNGHEPRSRSHSLGDLGIGSEPEPKIQALSFSGREKPAPRGWIVDNHVWAGHATSWFGEGGVAKSLLALHLGLTVAEESRSYWMAFAVKTVPVLYLDFELDADEQHRRALDLAAGMKLKGIPENFYYLSVAMMKPEEAFKLAAKECRRLGVKLVIVDSVGFALDGDSEHAKDVLGFYRERIQPLKDAGASPLLIDHQAKGIKGEKYSDKQAFGSVYKTNAVRSSFQIRGSHEQGEITATFTHKKNNFGWKERDFSLKVAFEEGRATVERLEAAMPNPDREPSKKEQVLEAVEELGRATAEMVEKKTDIDLKTVRNSISELLKEGALIDTKEKQNRSRIVIPHSHTTKGTGTKDEAAEPTLKKRRSDRGNTAPIPVVRDTTERGQSQEEANEPQARDTVTEYHHKCGLPLVRLAGAPGSLETWHYRDSDETGEPIPTDQNRCPYCEKEIVAEDLRPAPIEATRPHPPIPVD